MTKRKSSCGGGNWMIWWGYILSLHFFCLRRKWFESVSDYTVNNNFRIIIYQFVESQPASKILAVYFDLNTGKMNYHIST